MNAVIQASKPKLACRLQFVSYLIDQKRKDVMPAIYHLDSQITNKASLESVVVDDRKREKPLSNFPKMNQEAASVHPALAGPQASYYFRHVRLLFNISSL